MSVTIWKKGAGLRKCRNPSNKTELASFRTAYLVELEDGTTVRVSKLAIDRVSIISEIPAAVFGIAADAESFGDFGKVFEEVLDDPDCPLKKAPGGLSEFSKGWAKKGERRAFFKHGQRKARVEVSLYPLKAETEAFPGWRVRAEWNPRKTGPTTLKALEAIFADHLFFTPNQAKELFSSSRITRLDIAIDIVGTPRDTVFSQLNEQALVQTYSGKEGIETVYHRTGKTTKGSPALAVYDKRKQQLGASKVPKYGEAYHVRVERRVKRQGKSAIPLAQLGVAPNMLWDTRIRLLRPLPSVTLHQQKAAAAIALWLGAKGSPTQPKDLKAAFKVVHKTDDVDFWDVETLWSSWEEAVVAAGLDLSQSCT